MSRSLDSAKSAHPIVQIVGPADGSVLDRLAKRLTAKLPYATFSPGAVNLKYITRIAYYVDHALYSGPSGLVDVALFMGDDTPFKILERARAVDYCVSMSSSYADQLLAADIQTVRHISMAFDYYGHRPRLALGVFGLLDRRCKNEPWVNTLRNLNYIEVVTIDRNPGKSQLLDFYQRIDYILIPKTLQGGSVHLLEGLSMGKPVIASDAVGLASEFSDTQYLHIYPEGNLEELVKVVGNCYDKKLSHTKLVLERTWDRCAEAHHDLFKQLLQARGIELPQPSAGFRFGMMKELNTPLGIDVAPLETAIDDAAANLFFGRCGEARTVIESILPQFPFAAKLLDTFPGGEERSSAECTKHRQNSKLGCVLAILDRPPERLERTLQTFAYQTFKPHDKLLLDYGSKHELADKYRQLCERFSWRYISHTPRLPGWSLSKAYNRAIDLLIPEIDVVFKSDIDVLLGDDVLAHAAKFGCEKLCIFSCLGAVEGTVYPKTFAKPADVESLLKAVSPPEQMLGEGIHACPRRWFTEIGGFDEQFHGWGYEDSDLRVRAQKSIGIHNDTTVLLIHQWHSRFMNHSQVAENRAHYERMKSGPLVRNGGKLVNDEVLPAHGLPDLKPLLLPAHNRPESFGARNLNLAFATRSINEVLYWACDELLGLDRLAKYIDRKPSHHRLTGTDSIGYFRDLLTLDADWIVNVDEDAFVLEPELLLDVIVHMEKHGFAVCGVPDGGVVTIRQHNPVACNAFFNIFDMRRVRPAWKDWQAVLLAKHKPEFEDSVPPFARHTRLAFDQFEPYYCVYFSLLEKGERILYLDAQEWQDGITTLVKGVSGKPMLLHGWYSRSWDTNPDTRARYRIAIDYARWRQGLPLLPAELSVDSPPTTVCNHESNLGKWETLFKANRDPFPFGDTLTYEKAASYLGDLKTIEDWGGGQGWFRRYLKPSVRYKTIDGSQSDTLDQLADLTEYSSQVEGILLRHVLEHNEQWATILNNAMRSFTKRMVLVLFTPFAEETRTLSFNATICVPDIAFAKNDLISRFNDTQWSLEENVRTKTQYGVEQVFYLEKKPNVDALDAKDRGKK